MTTVGGSTATRFCIAITLDDGSVRTYGSGRDNPWIATSRAAAEEMAAAVKATARLIGLDVPYEVRRYPLSAEGQAAGPESVGHTGPSLPTPKGSG